MNTREIEDAILDAMVDSRDLPRELDRFLDRVADTWRSLSPEETGAYKRAIEAKPSRARLTASALRRGALVGTVENNDPAAPFVEFGTEDTEEFAPMRKTYARFMN